MVRDYLAHMLIGTPLQKPAQYLYKIRKLPKRWKHPELKELYLESSRIDLMMNRLIQDSMNCIDVGCHIGSMLNQMLQLSPNGHHIAIEPVAYKVEWLKRKFPSVEVHQVALSDKTDKVVYYHYPQKSGFDGLILNKNFSSQVITSTIECKRLDDLLSPTQSIHFIKIDVEGNELAVLRGAEQLLIRCQPSILFECTLGNLARFNFTPEDIFNYLIHNHNYSVFLIKDWLSGNKSLDIKAFKDSMKYPFQAFNFLAVAS